jgi:hypothetical protein
MELMRKVAWVTLTMLTGFLALTASLGGIGILAGLNTPPVDFLKGSIFSDFTIPGLSLLVIVGGGALLATVLLARRSRYALPAALSAGLTILCFEFVEVLVIGSPPGIAQILQVFYFGLGTAIAMVSIGIWLLDLSSASR